jgi:hypothetical protein
MGIPGIFKKAGLAKQKIDKSQQGAEAVDKSLFRIGVYGHKGVGKTVFFTIAYVSSKNSPEFEIMALGETQEILEEKYNLMRGQGIDLGTGKKISERRFPPLSTGEQRLNFEVRTGKNKLVPVNTIDYSGELIYIDARGDIKQNLIDFFKNCECVLFFIDPEAIQNEGERSNRIAAFTDLIGQLSSLEKRLKIPIGLVVSKSDELSGFKSSDQSVLISSGNGYIRALNFSGFLRGVLKQRSIAGRADWKSELEMMLNRLESFFKPLLNRTMDYQMFFISSTGNSPDFISDPSCDKIRIPPEDLRPLGVATPLKWAISRISAYRRAVVYKAVLKWTFLLIALVIDLVALGHFYNYLKLNELHRNINGIPSGVSDYYNKIGKAYNDYGNNVIIRTFFSDYYQKAIGEYKYFSNIDNNKAQTIKQNQIKQKMDETEQNFTSLGALRSDTAQYNLALAALGVRLDSLDKAAAIIMDSSLKNNILGRVATLRQQLESAPTGGQITAAQNLKGRYDALRTEFNESLANQNYDYLLNKDQFPAKLKALRDSIMTASPDDQLAQRYAANILRYLNAISSNFETGVLIPFKVEGATGGESGFSLLFQGASEAPRGDIDNTRTDLQFRVPVISTQQFTIGVRKSGADILETYPVNSGYSILKLQGQRIRFVDANINISITFDLDRYFYPIFKDKL